MPNWNKFSDNPGGTPPADQGGTPPVDNKQQGGGTPPAEQGGGAQPPVEKQPERASFFEDNNPQPPVEKEKQPAGQITEEQKKAKAEQLRKELELLSKTPEQIASEQKAAKEEQDRIAKMNDAEKQTYLQQKEQERLAADIFGGTPGQQQQQSQTPTTDFTNLVKDLGWDVKDPITDPGKFMSLVNEKIESAKQVVQLDPTKYNKETNEFFEYINNEGDPIELIDPMKAFNDYLVLTPKDKVLQVLLYAGKSEKEAKATVDTMIEEGSLDKEAAKYTNDAIAERDKLRQTLIANYNKKMADKKIALQNEQKQEVEQIKKAVSGVTNFMGLPLNDNVRNMIAADFESGTAQKLLNTAEAQIGAYLYSKYGQKAIEVLTRQIQEAKKNGFSDGITKNKEVLHNIPPEQSLAAGHTSGRSGQEKDRYKSWDKYKT